MPNRTGTTESPDIEDVFKALADPTRRAVVERLGHGPAVTSDLAAAFNMALPSFVQHLRILEDRGVVASRKEGRVRTYWLTPDPLTAAEAWLSEQRATWERRLDQLDEHLMKMRKEQQ